MDKALEKRLIDLCVNIFAHAENDYEVTLSGNGVNCYEAALTAEAFLDEMGVKKATLRARIAKEAKALRKEYGA